MALTVKEMLKKSSDFINILLHLWFRNDPSDGIVSILYKILLWFVGFCHDH